MIACPYCAFPIELKGVRAGAFQPKCPRCGQKFGLTISAESGVAPKVTRLTSKAPSTSATQPPSHTASAKPSPAQPAQTAAPHRTVAMPAAATSSPATPLSATPPSPTQTAMPARGAPVTPPLGAVTQAGPSHAASATPAPAASAGSADIAPGATLGGYTVLQKLGAGGMGAVYLARQNSLDRNVALKTLHPKLADDPQLVARFTREAFAAAQLTHHNIVQIYDIGQENHINFFSMEFVQGRTLSDVLRETHKLDVETGVGYILQAARGLKFAHEHGLIHRDIKPENLLLNDQGVVKVADLGLVKRVGAEEVTSLAASSAAADLAATQFNKSMGTPLYMPPEQATDAAHVDHRADIYSLGCTLYHLITGQPPFTGRTAMEVITKHASAPVTPPDVVVQDVPNTLSPVIIRMLAKLPEGRFGSMKDVIDSLEGFLGIASAGPYTPTSEQIKVLEFAAAAYNASPWTRFRSKIVLAFYAFCALLAALLAYINRDDLITATNLVGGVVGLAALTTLAYLITAGFMQRQLLFMKIRQLIFGAGVRDWLTWVGGIAVFGMLVYAFGLWVPWMVAAVGAILLAQAFYWTFDVAAARSRERPLQSAEHLIKTLRLRGLDENAIRQFVCRFSGREWEAFYEALFGYEDKLQARQVWGKERGKDRPKFAAWREPVIAYIDHRIEARKRHREAKLLARLEQKAMQAKGIEAHLAARQANKNAERLIDRAAKVRRTSHQHITATLAPPPPLEAAIVTGRSIAPTAAPASAFAASLINDVHHDDPNAPAGHDRHYQKQSFLRRRFGTPLEFITAGFPRAVIGLLLLSVFAHWWTTRSAANITQTGSAVLNTRRTDAAELVAPGKSGKEITIAGIDVGQEATALQASTPLDVPFIPSKWTRPIGPLPFLVAGTILLIGAFFRGILFGLAMYLSALIALIGPVSGLPMITGQVVLAALTALALWAFAVIFLRVKHA